MSVRCLLGVHFWIGHPPFGLSRHHGPLCWRTCGRCGKRSYGIGYDEQAPWRDVVQAPPPCDVVGGGP